MMTSETHTPESVRGPLPTALADWEDPDVQLVYQLLCDTDFLPPSDEHWEGFCARRIVAALASEGEVRRAANDIRWQNIAPLRAEETAIQREDQP
jgi:hypothetical protein